MKKHRSKQISGCTAGVVRINDGILFFKNRDLGSEYLVNRTTVYQSNPDIHVLKGVNLTSKEHQGISIGVNKSKICVANTHVISTDDTTYDILCETLLNNIRKKEDLPIIVETFMQKHTMQGGRILVSSPKWSYLIEVYKHIYKIREAKNNFIITNTFSLISHPKDREKEREESSINRLTAGLKMIQSISTIGMLKSMLRSHIPEKGDLSICNHSQDGFGTESSHIVQIQGDYIGWWSLLGYPCENEYQVVQLFQ